MKKIVITGMGAVTPVGIGVENYWQALLEGRCGIGEMARIPAEGLPVTHSAEVKDFDAKALLGSRLAAELDVYARYAYAAAEEAFASFGPVERPERVGLVMGTALHGIALTGATQHEMEEKGMRRVGPRFISQVMGNMTAANFAIQHGLKGPSFTVSTACSSGGDAISLAAMLLESGAADAMLVMAGEAAECALSVLSLSRAGALSKSGHSRPFDKARDGFVMGEGGGALLLETAEHAAARGARVCGALLGWGNNHDAYHQVSPEPNGAGAAACMGLALGKAGLTPEQIGYVNAHGTATEKGDIAESAAIRAVFGARPVPVSSTKGATGHMMGAGGVTEVIACVKAVETGLLPPTAGLTEPDESLGLSFVWGKPLECPIETAMSNALGFGGQNSSIIVGKF